MALAFLLIGVAVIVSALRNTQGALGSLLIADAPGFAKWAAAILAIGVLQYVPSFAVASKYLLVLVLLVIVIVNKGAFANFQSALSGAVPNVQGGPTPTLTGNPTVNVNGGSSSGGTAGQAIGAASAASKIIPFL